MKNLRPIKGALPVLAFFVLIWALAAQESPVNQTAADNAAGQETPPAKEKKEQTVPGTFHVRGKVLFAGQPVPEVSVAIKKKNLVLITDAKGEFDFYPLEGGAYDLEIIHPEIKTRKVAVFVRHDFYIELDVKKETYHLKTGYLPAAAFRPSSYYSENSELLRLSPDTGGLGGNYFQQLPSVTRASSRYVAPVFRSQGGSQRNSVLLDGLVFDSPWHSNGLYPVLDPARLQSVEVYGGVFPLTERDAQGAARISWQVPDSVSGRSGGDVAWSMGSPSGNGAPGGHLGLGLHYQPSAAISGNLSLTRTYLDLPNLIVGVPSQSPLYFNYMGKNTVYFSARHRLELVYAGKADSRASQGYWTPYLPVFPAYAGLTTDGRSQIKENYYAEQIRYEYNPGEKLQLAASWRLRQRYSQAALDGVNHYRENSSTMSFSPSFSFNLGSSAVLSGGADIFLENHHAAGSYQSAFFSGMATYFDPGFEWQAHINNAVDYGAFARYRVEGQKAGFDLSGRYDLYNESRSSALSGAALFYLRPTAGSQLDLAAGRYNQRLPVRYYAGSGVYQLVKPEGNWKAEAGLTLAKSSAITYKATVFAYYWDNLVRPAAISGSNFSIYENADQAGSGGLELSMQKRSEKWTWRLAYTGQYMPANSAFLKFFHPHILNGSLFYQGKTWQHSWQVQLMDPQFGITTDFLGTPNINLGLGTFSLDYRVELRTAFGMSIYFAAGFQLRQSAQTWSANYDQEMYDLFMAGVSNYSPVLNDPGHAALGVQWRF